MDDQRYLYCGNGGCRTNSLVVFAGNIRNNGPWVVISGFRVGFLIYHLKHMGWSNMERRWIRDGAAESTTSAI